LESPIEKTEPIVQSAVVVVVAVADWPDDTEMPFWPAAARATSAAFRGEAVLLESLAPAEMGYAIDRLSTSSAVILVESTDWPQLELASSDAAAVDARDCLRRDPIDYHHSENLRIALELLLSG
jgi:hypothetical protein